MSNNIDKLENQLAIAKDALMQAKLTRRRVVAEAEKSVQVAQDRYNDVHHALCMAYATRPKEQK